jgi:hypothetical protein
MKNINNLDGGIGDEMGCDRLFQLKDLPAVFFLTVATRPTPSMHGVGIVVGIVRMGEGGARLDRVRRPGPICHSAMRKGGRDQVDALDLPVAKTARLSPDSSRRLGRRADTGTRVTSFGAGDTEFAGRSGARTHVPTLHPPAPVHKMGLT